MTCPVNRQASLVTHQKTHASKKSSTETGDRETVIQTKNTRPTYSRELTLTALEEESCRGQRSRAVSLAYIQAGMPLSRWLRRETLRDIVFL